MVKRTVKKPTTKFDPKAFQETAEQWSTVKKEKEAAQKRQDTLRLRLVSIVEQFGEADDYGHVFLDLDEEVDGLSGFKWERRVSRPLDEDEAEAILKKRRLLSACQTTITVLDESKIEALMYEGKITDEEYAKMFPEKETRALQPVKA